MLAEIFIDILADKTPIYIKILEKEQCNTFYKGKCDLERNTFLAQSLLRARQLPWLFVPVMKWPRKSARLPTGEIIQCDKTPEGLKHKSYSFYANLLLSELTVFL